MAVNGESVYFGPLDSFSTRTCVLMEIADTFFDCSPRFSTGNEKQSRSLKATVETPVKTEVESETWGKWVCETVDWLVMHKRTQSFMYSHFEITTVC